VCRQRLHSFFSTARHALDIFPRKNTLSATVFYFPGKIEFKLMRKIPSARENSSSSSSTTIAREEETEWEMRPGGMLVQKRTVQTDAPTRNLRLRVTYGALRYEICVSSMATFGKTSSGSKLPLLIFFCSGWLLGKLLF